MHRAKVQYTPCPLDDGCRTGRFAPAHEGAHRSALSVVFSKKSGFSAPTTESFILMSTSCGSLHASARPHPCGAPEASGRLSSCISGLSQTLVQQCSLKPLDALAAANKVHMSSERRRVG